MHIKLSSEQELLQESAARYLRERYAFAERTRILGSAAGHSEAIWRDFAEMGWLGLAFPERYGGSGGSLLDVMLLSKALGRALVVEPFLSTVVLGGLAILHAGTDEQKQTFLPRIASGRLQVALGFAEPHASYDAHDVKTMARPDGRGFRIDGHKAVVLGAPSADHIVVSARTDGEQRDLHGISLFIVERSTAGVSLRTYQTIDGRRAAEVILRDVRVAQDALLGELGGGATRIDDTLLAGRVAVMGEAAGALRGAVDQTIEYLNMREQFGNKLASYQALRHRLADMYVATREVEAITGIAAQAYEHGDGDDRAAMICGAKAYVGEEGRWVAENAVQLHGAIAIADEYVVGHFLKRLVAIDRLFGDVGHNLDRFMEKTSLFA